MTTREGWDSCVMLDRAAAKLARGVGAMMLLLGEALAALAARGAQHRLGFSSLGAYVQERCSRSATWARDLVRVARDLGAWPRLRQGVLEGSVTWSAAEVVLRALRPLAAAKAGLDAKVLEDAEARWLELAQGRTVRELRAALHAERTNAPGSAASSGERPEETTPNSVVHPFVRRLPVHVLTLSVPIESAWWFECAREVYRSVSECNEVYSTQSFLVALLAEARVELEGWELGSEDAIERWGSYVDQLATWREESERRCDAQRAELEAARNPIVERMPSDVFGAESHGELDLDRRVRELATALTRRDLELGRLAEWLHRAEAWRRLGFASEAHYVRERMGMSHSQWKMRRSVARKLGAFPALEAAVSAGELGLETASLVVRILHCAFRHLGCDGLDLSAERRRQRAAVEQAWLDRARSRTCKHLREEVAAAELGAQQGGVFPGPPSEETMRRFLALQGRVRSGAVLFEGPHAGRESVTTERCADSRTSVATSERLPDGRTSVASRAWLDLRGELREIFLGAFLSDLGGPPARHEPGRQEPGRREPAPGRGAQARHSHPARVRLRLRIERDTLVEFRYLERLFRKRHPGGDFFEFLCRHFLAVWAPTTLSNVKYSSIYRRDAFTCSSPVCTRHDVQPHHLKFRSAGGGEEDENLTSLCTWCHLEGVHRGRIRVAPPASSMHWQIGPGLLEVHGRMLVSRK